MESLASALPSSAGGLKLKDYLPYMNNRMPLPPVSNYSPVTPPHSGYAPTATMTPIPQPQVPSHNLSQPDVHHPHQPQYQSSNGTQSLAATGDQVYYPQANGSQATQSWNHDVSQPAQSYWQQPASSYASVPKSNAYDPSIYTNSYSHPHQNTATNWTQNTWSQPTAIHAPQLPAVSQQFTSNAVSQPTATWNPPASQHPINQQQQYWNPVADAGYGASNGTNNGTAGYDPAAYVQYSQPAQPVNPSNNGWSQQPSQGSWTQPLTPSPVVISAADSVAQSFNKPSLLD
jgi:hypothetical protein